MTQPLLSELMPEFMQHTVTIEPYAGTAGDGAPTYGTALTLVGFLDAKRRIVRTPASATSTGDEVIAEATFYTDRGPVIPSDSRATLPDGSTSRVLAVLDRDGGTLPLPSHLEVVIA